MEMLKEIKSKLEKAVYEELEHNFECVNIHELGEVIDMIKDIEKTIYYKTIIHAMEKDNYEMIIEEDIEHKMPHIEAHKKDHSE